MGPLSGNFCYDQGEGRRNNPQFILGRHEKSWLGSIRAFVTNAANATCPELKGDDSLVIKEPNGSELDFPAGEADLVRAVEEHAFEGMPQEARGPEKIACKATPGSRGEDLTPDQVRVVQSIAVTLFKEFYPV